MVNIIKRVWRWWKQARIRRSLGISDKRFYEITPHIDGLSVDLYEAHCLEIKIRLEYGDDLNDPTDAEVLGYLGNKYQRWGLLTQNETIVFVRLFNELFPDESMPLNIDDMEELDLDGIFDKKFQELEELLRADRMGV